MALDANAAAPFLRWAGSKRALLPIFTRKFPQNYNKYIEPFAGSACLFFRLAPGRAVISDLNQQLIETYCIIRENAELVGEILADMPVGRDEYYAMRDTDPKELSEAARAARFIYLNRFCFNGLYRTNLAGKFNVPYGAPKNNRVPTTLDLQASAAVLRKATLLACDFEETVRTHVTTGDLVYLDPPFFRSSVRVFREYNARAFDGSDLDRLAKILHWIDDRGAMFFLSYAYCKEAKEKFSSWKFFTAYTTRNISGFAEHRKRAREIVFTNYATKNH